MLFSLPPAVCSCHLFCVSTSDCSAVLGKIIIWGGRSSFQSVQGTDITGELRDLSTDIAKDVPRKREESEGCLSGGSAV